MATKIITFRLPEALIQAITSHAQTTGRCKTAVVVDALNHFFCLSSNTIPPAFLTGLQQKQDALTKKFAYLNQQVAQFTQEESSEKNSQNLEDVNQSLAASQAFLNEISLSSPSTSQIQNIGVTEDSVVNQDSKSINNSCEEFEENLQQLTTKVEERAKILEQVLSASVDHICMYDRLGRYTYANRAFIDSFGLKLTAIYGKTSQQMGFPTETIKHFEAKLQIALATGQSIAEEISLTTVNGHREYEYILSPIHSTDGSIKAVVYTARDITERKQAEALVRESEKNYRNLFECANDSIFITDSSNNTLLNVNEHGARRLGYTRKQLLKLPTEEFSPPLNPQKQEALLRQLWKTGSVIFEHIHQCRDGSQIPVEINSRVVEYKGQLAIQSFVRDITARTQAQTALQASQHFIDRLTESNPCLIYIQDLIQEFPVYLNSKVHEFFGLTPEALKEMGKAFFTEFLHPEDVPKLTEIKKRLATARDGEVIENEFRMKNANGEWRWLHTWEVVFSRTSAGFPDQILSTALDITICNIGNR
ncbi:MAG: PAS domain S-box protein [Potamolinea sp.]